MSLPDDKKVEQAAVPITVQTENLPAIQGGVDAAIPVEALEKSLNQAERYMKALDRIRKLAIKMTNYADWTNQGGKPYLLKSGCDKIAGGFGIRVENAKYIEPETVTDELGEYRIYTVTGDFVWQNNYKSNVGKCSTRDSFFCMKDGSPKPLSEIDVVSVQKKAFTNMLQRGIKDLLGLAYTWQEIKEYSEGKIDKDTCAHVNYQSKGNDKSPPPADTEQDKILRSEIGSMLMEMNNGDKNALANQLEKYSEFPKPDKSGMVKGKRNRAHLKGKRLQVTHNKIKEDYTNFKKSEGAM
jgi:hypothetical protein